MEDKRVHSRFTLWLPVRVDARSGRMEAVLRDASPGGVLISPAAGSEELSVGDKVTITFQLEEGGESNFILGRIVRVEAPGDDGTRRMAVEFVKPVPQLEALFRRASSRPPPPPAR